MMMGSSFFFFFFPRQKGQHFFTQLLLVAWMLLLFTIIRSVVDAVDDDDDPKIMKFYPATISSDFNPNNEEIIIDDYDYYYYYYYGGSNPPIKTTTTYRQNICDRQQQYANGEIGLKEALSGLELHPVITSAVPEVFIPITKDVVVETATEFDEWGREVTVNTTQPMMGYNPESPGLLVRVLEEVAIRANFTWKQSYGIVGGIGGTNATFDDLAFWMANNYDIAVFPLSHLPHRFEMGLNFPAGITDNTIIMIGLEEDYESDVWNQLLTVFQPFSWQVWVIIICTIFFSAFISWVLEYDRTPIEERSWRPQTRNVFWASMAFTGNFDVSEITTNPNMIFQFSLSFWALLIVSAYTANLASFFVIQNTPSLNIDTLEEAMQYQLPICVNRGTYIDFTLKERYPTSTNVQAYGNITDAYRALTNRDCTILATEIDVWNAYRGSITINSGCQMKQIGRAYQFLQGGFAIKADHGTLCSSLIRDVINIHILEMIGSNPNVVEEIKKQTIYKNEQDCTAIAAANDANGGSADSDTYQLNLKEMAGTFALHVVLTTIALLLALFNKMKKKICGSTKKRRNKNHTERQQEDSTDGGGGGADDGVVLKASPLLLNQGKMIEQLIQIQLDMKTDMESMSNRLNELSTSTVPPEK